MRLDNRFSVVITPEQDEMLWSVAESIHSSKAAAVRLLIDIGMQHLDIRR